ncbi:uncharacterized protein LOC129315481 [Prosopis cineraria]|uniref:uncharacterized protein LOC129315481 n=1 Tax=Prosopis cineraria TaxID=364024 RepID=UPI00240F9DCC|nr:uncharacterized protein LOC129315481 [Prosopis cineraria]
MRLSSASGSSLDKRRLDRSGSRLRKKHKRLDAICEKEYNRNHSELNEDGDGAGTSGPDAELRRSSRVRRAPAVLDASPPPPKKRRTLGKNVMLRSVSDVNSPVHVNQSSGEVECPGTWSSRLRSRVKNVGFRVKRERESSSGKRKLFKDMDESRDNEKPEVPEINKKEELEGGIPKVVKSKRPGRIKATKHAEEHKQNESHGNLDERKSQEVELSLNQDEESASISGSKLSDENVMEILDGNASPNIEISERNICDNLQLQEFNGDVELSRGEHVDKSDGQLESVKIAENGRDDVEIVGNLAKKVENEGSINKNSAVDEKALQDENIVKIDTPKQASNDITDQPRIKEGRRCGLCGGGTDGKPPKRLVQDNGESENEAYSGSSASEEPNYDPWDGFGDEPGWLGRLLGPINDRYGIAGIWVHQHCAVWSPEVYFAGLGCLKNVRAALCRGRALKCTRCGRRGATIGCRVDRCPKTYHLPCARANGCIFDHRKFLIACTDHRHLFQPQGNKYLARIKKLKARKMKLEIRKLSNDAWRKDIEAEEKWLENCGEDEEFLKRENKRLHRDLLRIAPIYIGGPDSDGEKSFQGWESVAGLKDVISCMKEVVILPLLYPEFFDNLGLTPPRGVLLHGYPGTGKTLVVRALIGACARGDKRIAYFARKGADCLGKYVGDAERQLRLLFQVAEKCQPSIIFFDEIDGLAPSRTRQQDQTHSSVVSTLLALLDGLKSRGSVVVIGATNRPDAVDPALRRPGRFDREIYFPLPSIEDRASILSLHTHRWPKPITGSLLDWIARKTPGFAGADLQSLCTQAAINALKRNFPLQEVLSAASEEDYGGKRLPLPSFAVEERDWLEALSCAPPPCSRREAGNAANDIACAPLPTHLIPCLLQPLCTLLVSLYLDGRLWLPPPMFKAVTRIKSTMISALDKKKMSVDHWWLHVDDFLQDADFAADIGRKLICAGILSANDGQACSCDPLDDTDCEVKLEPSIKHHVSTCSGLLSNKSFMLLKKSGFRILIAGNPKSGQRHLASCLIYCFVGNVEIQKIDMATISQEGHGDVVQGISQILMKCASVQSCVVFMPRIDLWAVETHFQGAGSSDYCSTHDQVSEMEESCLTPSQVVEKKNEFDSKKRKSIDMVKGQVILRASHAWMSFIEQVESIGVSTSLIILATSDVPCAELPCKVREFFRSCQSSCSQSASMVQTVPRFSVQIEGNFNHDVMISLSAVELMRNVIGQLVQLVHKKSHMHIGARKVHITYDSVRGCKDKAYLGKDNGSVNGDNVKVQLPEPSTKVPLPPNSRPLKQKSTLLLAISTFGYQIIRFPHFAELCWVTSKIKEGPSADVSGPWKGWPFNSCIIRPSTLKDKVANSCSSSNMKNKEKSGIVRGLMAVGLSAYRGAYTSVREVSSEVRKVLEILVGKINTKVQAGKDRYQFLRILSQVAYLEDMVNNWAYALLSLEQDSPDLAAKLTSTSVGSLNGHENQQMEDEGCQLVGPMEGHEPEKLERSPNAIAAKTPGSLALSDRNDNVDNVVHSSQVSEGSPQSSSFPDDHINNSAALSQPADPVTIVENGTLAKAFESGTTGNHEMINGEIGPSKGSNGSSLATVSVSGKEEFKLSKGLNGSTSTHSVAFSDNELLNARQPEGVEIEDSRIAFISVPSLSSAETGIKLSGVDSGVDANAVEISDSPSKRIDPDESGIICLYRCCPGCLNSLYHLTRKILVHERCWNGSNWAVEDVHDVLSSLSVDLISAVRKIYSAKDFNDIYAKSEVPLDCSNSRMCNPRNLDRVFMPAECVSHSTGQHTAGTKDTASNELKLDLNFVFRDGVLVQMDPDKEVSLHCKFETLCLCSFKESIVMTKHPFG